MATIASENFTTPVATLQYPTLASAKPDETGKLKYSCCLIFDADPTTPELSSSLEDMKKAILDVAVKAFGDKAVNMLKTGVLRHPFRDGLQKEGKPGFGEGKLFFNATTQYKPACIDQNVNEILDVTDQLYPGCQVRASINFYSYDSKGNKGIAVGLSAIQKWGDADRLSGGVDIQSAFGAPKKSSTESLFD